MESTNKFTLTEVMELHSTIKTEEELRAFCLIIDETKKQYPLNELDFIASANTGKLLKLRSMA